MGWGMLTSFRLMTGDGFSEIFSDTISSTETIGAYTFLIGAALVLWHLFTCVVLQAAILAYTLEYFSYSSWQQHWVDRDLLSGAASYVFDSILGETGRIQKVVDPALVKLSAWFDTFQQELRYHFSSRVQPIHEDSFEVEKLPSILSRGEETPAVQSWWRNTPVLSNSPVGEEKPGEEEDSGFLKQRPETGGNFMRHADHFIKPDGESAAAGDVSSPTAQVKNSRWSAVRFMMEADHQHGGSRRENVGPAPGVQLKKKKAMTAQQASATLLAFHAMDDSAGEMDGSSGAKLKKQKSVHEASDLLQEPTAVAEEGSVPTMEAAEPLAARLNKRRSLREASRLVLSVEGDQRGAANEGGGATARGKDAAGEAVEPVDGANGNPSKDDRQGGVQVEGKDFGAGEQEKAATGGAAGTSDAGTASKGWMRLKGMGAPKIVLKAVGFVREMQAPAEAAQNSHVPAQGGSAASGSDEYDSEEEMDVVGELGVGRKSVSRDSRRPQTQETTRASVGSESLAFSAYEPDSPEVRSHRSGDTRQESASPKSSEGRGSTGESLKACRSWRSHVQVFI